MDHKKLDWPGLKATPRALAKESEPAGSAATNTAFQPVSANAVRYIKLGPAEAWESQCLETLPVDAVEDQQHQLISSRRVEGTAVYNALGEKLGTVHSVMLDKQSGHAAYAIMSFGGFLGMGDVAHPIPWDMLTYDEKRDGYVVDLSVEQLERVPTFRLDESDRPRERTQEDAIYGYYGLSSRWPI